MPVIPPVITDSTVTCCCAVVTVSSVAMLFIPGSNIVIGVGLQLTVLHEETWWGSILHPPIPSDSAWLKFFTSGRS